MSSGAINRYGNALDPQAMTRLRADLKSPTPETAREVARQFESLFVAQMLKSMRAATPGDALLGGAGESQYRQLMDTQLAQEVSRGRGLGLAPIIERQLLAGMGLSEPEVQAPDGPLESDAPVPDAQGAAVTGDRGQGPLLQEAASLAAPTVEVGDKGEAFASPREFVRSVWKAAQSAAETLGVPVKALVAQAALETGWGRHVIRDGEGRSSFNFFGIKSHRDWRGDSVKVPTLEYRDGVAAKELASFRAYDSLEQSFRDYADFLRSNPRYEKALRAGDADEFVQGLQEAGYATDPAYAEKIRKIMDSPLLSEGEQREDGARGASPTAGERT